MTRGSKIFKDFMPGEDSVLVERLKRAGVIPIGKTNVSEFGMGSHTYNDVYGVTLNPYDLTKAPAVRAVAPAQRWPQACCRLQAAAISAAR